MTGHSQNRGTAIRRALNSLDPVELYAALKTPRHGATRDLEREVAASRLYELLRTKTSQELVALAGHGGARYELIAEVIRDRVS